MLRTAARTATTSPAAHPLPGAAPELVSAYDYAAVFRLTGTPGSIHQDVITISPDAIFVAVAISYGLDEVRSEPLAVTLPGAPATFVPADIQLGQIAPDALLGGVRVATRLEPVVFDELQQVPGVRPRPLQFSSTPVPSAFAATVLERVVRPEQFSFFLSIVDTASGRELQDEPMHSLASLGRSDGKRPFRPLARPMVFMPRTTVRFQVSEQTPVTNGSNLFVVLHGYRVYTTSGCPESLTRSVAPLQHSALAPGEGAIPFDYVVSLELTGRAGNLVVEEVAVHTDTRFVATAIGYGLDAGTTTVDLPQIPDPVDLDTLPLRAFAAEHLRDGVRLRKGFSRFAFDSGGALATVNRDLARRMFERVNQPEEVSFLYTIFDGGAGRDLQNRPIHNIAGLGDASGERPFKTLLRPMQFLPRSTIRITVEERVGRGRLYLVLQGFKVTGSSMGGRR